MGKGLDDEKIELEKAPRKLIKWSTRGIVISAVILLLSVGTVIALLSWHGRIEWTVESKEFGVYTDASCTTPKDTIINLGTVLSGTLHQENYWLKNEGNVPITIEAKNETGSGYSGKTWNASPARWTIPVGENRLAQVSFTMTDSGNYEFDFSIA